MKEYDIKITETLERTVTVKAESVDDAKAQVEEEWGKSMHVLDSEDFAGVEFTMQEERSLDLEKMDALLKPREKEILILRFGLRNSAPLTQNQVAKIFGISRSYVSRIETKAISKLSNEFTSDEK